MVAVASLMLCICDASRVSELASAVDLASATGGEAGDALNVRIATKLMVITEMIRMVTAMMAREESCKRAGFAAAIASSALAAGVFDSAPDCSTTVFAHSCTVVGFIVSLFHNQLVFSEALLTGTRAPIAATA